MISWMMAARSGVRWAAPSSPLAIQSGGVQATVASVAARDETLPLAEENVWALSESSPPMIRLVTPLETSSTVNWI